MHEILRMRNLDIGLRAAAHGAVDPVGAVGVAEGGGIGEIRGDERVGIGGLLRVAEGREQDGQRTKDGCGAPAAMRATLSVGQQGVEHGLIVARLRLTFASAERFGRVLVEDGDRDGADVLPVLNCNRKWLG